MKVLTLHQLRASLAALGVKTIETRSWSTKYRGPLAIHAAARRPDDIYVGDWYPFEDPPGYAMQTHPGGPTHPLPLGAIIATCTLVDVVPIVGLGEETAVRRVEVGTAAGQPNLMLCAADPTVTRYPPEVSFQFNDEPEAGVDFDASDYYERDVTDQLPYGDYTVGGPKHRYAYLLADIVPLDPPVPFKGGQGLTKSWEPVPA